MTSPLDRTVGADEPAPYAPKRVHDAAHAARRNTGSIGFENFEEDDLSQTATPAVLSDRGVVIEGFRLPRSLEPMLLSKPRLASVLGRPALAIAVAAVIAFIAHGKPSTSGATKSGDESSALPRFQGQTSVSAARPSQSAPKLVVSQAASRGIGEAFPLGISIRGPGNDALLIIRGLANGATLSAGSPASDASWHVSAAHFNNLMIRPPPQFSGTMDLTVELRLGDDTIADRTPLRFEWAGATVPEAKPKAYSALQLDPNDIAALLKRGDELMARGDLAAARLVLQRAAEAGDARAALTLAGTYDPMVLEKLSVHGLVPNIAKARDWYEKAGQLGATLDASRPLLDGSK